MMDIDSLVNYWSLVLVGQARDNVKKNHFLARSESGKYSFITWGFWAELRNTIFTPDALAERFQNYIDEANLGGARERNFQRWPDSGGEGAGITEFGTSEYIRDLLVTRLNFVDGKINALPE